MLAKDTRSTNCCGLVCSSVNLIKMGTENDGRGFPLTEEEGLKADWISQLIS
jgi:hypothetical protein